MTTPFMAARLARLKGKQDAGGVTVKPVAVKKKSKKKASKKKGGASSTD